MGVSFFDDSDTMAKNNFEANRKDPFQMDCAELVAACAMDTDNSAVWGELLSRYGLRMKQFIRKAWNLWLSGPSHSAEEVFGGEEQSDLFQTTIVRLIENDCAVMKRFFGTTEDEWLAYLAKIACSAVRDAARRQRRSKRFGYRSTLILSSDPLGLYGHDRSGTTHRDLERRILSLEILAVCERMIGNLSGQDYARDSLIFRLYFIHDLSISQIAECKGLTLSKSGVRDVINRLTCRCRGAIDRRERETRGLRLTTAGLGLAQGVDAIQPPCD